MYWADLHNHNEIGYGKGSLQRSYALAENSLEVYAFTPHGHWPDPPSGDHGLVRAHAEAFERVSVAFPEVVATANARYRPGRFVTFPAYEWHSTRWGDYVVLFQGAEADLHRAGDLEDLKDFARRRGALLIPHHVAYRRGWRGLDWEALDPELSPLVEVFNEHGNSLERDALWPMLLHSMGGATESQSALAQMRRKRHFGLTAGTDNHYGYPASYGEGITGIVSDELTREAIFDALRARHTCAATGDRIELSVRSGEALMGDVRPAGAAREFEVEVHPLAPLDTVRIVRNGQTAQLWPGPLRPDCPPAGNYLVRLHWGWGRMGQAESTDWDIAVQVRGGSLAGAIPCFCGGPATERASRIHAASATGLRIKSFTSRENRLPVSGVVLQMRGDPSTRLFVSAQIRVEDEKGGCEVRASLDELLCDDAWGMPLERFSSPRLRVGQAHLAEAISFRATWRDPAPGQRDLYMVKAQQHNGQIVWSSPILFANDLSPDV